MSAALSVSRLEGFLHRCVARNLVLAPGSYCGSAYNTWVRVCFTSAPPDAVTSVVTTNGAAYSGNFGWRTDRIGLTTDSTTLLATDGGEDTKVVDGAVAPRPEASDAPEAKEVREAATKRTQVRRRSYGVPSSWVPSGAPHPRS